MDPEIFKGDFKEVFTKITALGAGRPIDEHGRSEGVWTPSLLVEAMTQEDRSGSGPDMRTVQLWFQDNDRSVSRENIVLLARVFGCGDRELTVRFQATLMRSVKKLVADRRSGERQVKLSSSNRRLVAERRKRRSGQVKIPASKLDPQPQEAASKVSWLAVGRRRHLALSQATEWLFRNGSAVGLPILVFSGMVALGLISVSLGIHSIAFTQANNTAKQVGFLWAPNWTVTFMVLVPLYLSSVSGLLVSATAQSPTRLSGLTEHVPSVWGSRVVSANAVFWTIFILTTIVASGLNWISTYLVPLLLGDIGAWSVDWGRVAIVLPEISVPNAIVFTGLAFIYNGIAAYLFFAGLAFLHLMTLDFVGQAEDTWEYRTETNTVELYDRACTLISGIFRATSLGLLITIMMKLQSSYLLSTDENILQWLLNDVRRTFGLDVDMTDITDYILVAPGYYYSFFSLLVIFWVFMFASVRLRHILIKRDAISPWTWFWGQWAAMDGVMVLLLVSYFLCGAVPGFVVVLLFSLVVVTVLNIFPPFGVAHRTETRE